MTAQAELFAVTAQQVENLGRPFREGGQDFLDRVRVVTGFVYDITER